jgi:hypothetical protein
VSALSGGCASSGVDRPGQLQLHRGLQWHGIVSRIEHKKWLCEIEHRYGSVLVGTFGRTCEVRPLALGVLCIV